MKQQFIIAGIMVSSSIAFGNFAGSDNFNDNALNTGIWGSEPTTDLVETNARLEFAADVSETNRWDNVAWKPGEGGDHASDWSVLVDVHLSGFDNSVWTNNWIELKLLAYNSSDRGDEFSIGFEIYAEDDGGTVERGQEICGMIATDGDFENSAEIWTDYSGSDVVLKLDYVASNTMLRSYYDTGSGFTVLTNHDASSWGMVASNTFHIELGVGVKDLDIASGQAYFDNFEATGTNDSPVIQVGIQGAIEIGWNSIAGRSYQVEYSTALDPGNWIELGDPVTGNGNGTTNHMLDTTRIDSERFYRVLLLD